jgi:hypothetical protein
VLGSSQNHLKIGRRDLDHPILASVKTTNSWCARSGDLQCAFPLDIPMVPSSAIAIDGECLTCGGLSLGETVRLGNFELITNYFDGLILSPIRGDTGAAFMGLAHSRASTL